MIVLCGIFRQRVMYTFCGAGNRPAFSNGLDVLKNLLGCRVEAEIRQAQHPSVPFILFGIFGTKLGNMAWPLAARPMSGILTPN
jgi:hypothetical protein